MPKFWNLRDMARRVAAAEAEPIRHSLKYIIHNTQNPAPVRAQAALDLTRMNGNTRITRIKNRCVLTTRGRGIMRDFRMNRIMFRNMALAGELPGVQKASW